MPAKPIFVATHPRACSTAFERVFMTRTDILNCVHEPFGDAFYYGPERLSPRFASDEVLRQKSGFADVTYKTVVDAIDAEADRDPAKRVFIKDIIHYLFPPDGKPARLAPSVAALGDDGDHDNPTVLPLALLRRFHFTFLIRHPRRAIPSYYRCTVPPLDHVTGFYHFLPSEAGYDELRRLFDYVRDKRLVGPALATAMPPSNGTVHNETNGETNGIHGTNVKTNGEANGKVNGKANGDINGVNGTNGTYGDDDDDDDGHDNNNHAIKITVIDADDLLDQPARVVRAYCDAVGIDFRPEMLVWEDDAHRERAAAAFEKWNGFHDDAIGSTSLKPRAHGVKNITVQEEDEQWRQKFGDEAQKVIRACVDANIPHYEYLKSFAVKF